MSYIAKYNITHAKLSQQYVSLGTTPVGFEGFELWLRQRAQELASVGNQFLAEICPPPAG